MIAGVLTLALVWLGPLPDMASQHFSAHMMMHIAVVAVAAPLLSFGLAGGPLDPVHRLPLLFSAIPASVLELVVVWTWHTPTLHHAARGSTSGLILEQSTFLVSAFLVWMSAFGGDSGRAPQRAGAGVIALLLTSMHMTLLGALIALAPRPLYAHEVFSFVGRSPLDDQHLGGAIMLLIGGVSYLIGGLYLSAKLLQRQSPGRSFSRTRSIAP
jgi:putative membrane protein